jgi:serine/threonine-protein kinase Chk1
MASDSGCDVDPVSDDTVKTLVVMKKGKGDPLEWRRLFRELCRRPEIQATIIST